jgi:hypothetical protein
MAYIRDDDDSAFSPTAAPLAPRAKWAIPSTAAGFRPIAPVAKWAEKGKGEGSGEDDKGKGKGGSDKGKGSRGSDKGKGDDCTHAGKLVANKMFTKAWAQWAVSRLERAQRSEPFPVVSNEPAAKGGKGNDMDGYNSD